MKRTAEPFFLGIITAFGALALELILSLFFSFNERGYLLSSLIGLGLLVLIEESSKFVVIRKSLLNNYDNKILARSCFIFGLGFGSIEIFLLSRVLNNNILLGSLGILLIHSITSLWIAILMSRLKGSFVYLAIIPSLLFHFAYNFLVYNDITKIAYLIIIFGIILSLGFWRQIFPKLAT